MGGYDSGETDRRRVEGRLKMKDYKVTIRETHYRSTEIEATSAEEARDIAETQDWSKWSIEDTDYCGETEIIEVKEVEV